MLSGKNDAVCQQGDVLLSKRSFPTRKLKNVAKVTFKEEQQTPPESISQCKYQSGVHPQKP